MSEQMAPAPRPVINPVMRDSTFIKCTIDECISAVEGTGKSRELSLAITKLQEARMWIEEHQRRN